MLPAQTQASACLDCAIGQFSETVGSDDVGNCIGCAAGKFVDVAGSDQSDDCIDCDAGRYVEVTGSSAAHDCIAASSLGRNGYMKNQKLGHRLRFMSFE